MATKVKALGTLLQVQISGTYTTIVQRASIDAPTVEITMQETTDLDSTFVERRPTLPDPTELGLSVWLDPNDTTHKYLRDSNAAASSTAETFKLIFPSSPTVTATFQGFVQSYKPGAIDPKNYLTAEVKIQLSGPITWT
jgi:hypothetical protein